VGALISAVVHSTSGKPSACTGPEAATNTVTLYVCLASSAVVWKDDAAWWHPQNILLWHVCWLILRKVFIM